MSEPTKSAAKYWRLLSYRDETPLERAFVDGILHALAGLTDPDYTLGLPTAAEVEEIERQVDLRRERRDATLYAEKVNAPLSPETVEERWRRLASGDPERHREPQGGVR